MKKYIKVLGLACMAGALAFMTSCKKNETSTSIRVGLNPVEEETDGERAYIDLLDNALKWQDGDAIMVFNINSTDPGQSMMAYYTAVEGSEGLTYTTFTTEAPTLGETQNLGYFVYYPAYRRNATEYTDPVIGDIDRDNRMSFTIEPVQHYFMGTHNGTDYDMATADPDALAMAWQGMTEAELNNFYLTNTFGSIKLGLTGSNLKVDHIEVINVVEEGETGGSLWGKASFNLAGVTYDKVNTLRQAMKDYRQYGTDNYAALIADLLNGAENLGYLPEDRMDNKLTLDCSDYMPQLEWTGATKYFYISVRPGAFMKGVQFKIYMANADNTPAGYYLIDDFNMTADGYQAPNANVYPFMVIPNIMKSYNVDLYGRTLMNE